MRAVVVVPTYNELANLKSLVEKLQQFAPELHILIVDDNSPDGTGQLAAHPHRRPPPSLSNTAPLAKRLVIASVMEKGSARVECFSIYCIRNQSKRLHICALR